ncbi:hypothetical protein [Nostoc edaphicum]|uniref:hypothetical protein n=1 Tax=Nostoc edaphicum TaxID=264686 RepID=UPI001D139770|nr:hypothetical protein [Nostoc edaphicum]
MQSKDYLFTAIAATILAIFNTQPSYAVSIIYEEDIESNISFDKVTYRVGNREGQAWVTDIKPLPRGGTPGLLRVLRDAFPDWRFLTAEPETNPLYSLNGEFRINQYYACGNLTLCGSPTTSSLISGVGALLSVDYIPGEGDPGILDNINWIQRVVSNHSASSGTHNDKEDILDTRSLEEPFYFPKQNYKPNFFDRPYRGDSENSHYWNAELFLAERVGRNTVMIYDGISWGWRNQTKRRREDYCPVKNISRDENCSYYYFSDNLSSGYEEDAFQLKELTPGKKFYAYIDNDIPGNRCNPNTLLEAYDDGYRHWMNDDNDSSPVGDGFGSALTGFVSNDGSINLKVRPANGGRRGGDRGNYELNVTVFNNEADFPYVVGSSGGGGVVVGSSGGGGVQYDPILPNGTEQGWQVFRNVPGCRWYDPHTPYGFEFQALDDTLFTEILDFPVGDDNRFTVSVGDRILGEFGAGDSVDFTSLFGSGISNFKITGIDSLFGSTEETAFPIQLAFNDRYGSFKMRPFSQESSPQSVPESTSALGLLALLSWGIIKAMKIRLEK